MSTYLHVGSNILCTWNFCAHRGGICVSRGLGWLEEFATRSGVFHSDSSHSWFFNQLEGSVTVSPLKTQGDLCRTFSSLPSSNFRTLAMATRTDPWKLRCGNMPFSSLECACRWIFAACRWWFPSNFLVPVECSCRSRWNYDVLGCVVHWEILFTFLEPLFRILATADSLIYQRISHRVLFFLKN